MKSNLSIKQKSLIFYFIDMALAAPNKINQLVRITLSSKLNTGSEFHELIEGFMDCAPGQVEDKCKFLSKKLSKSSCSIKDMH